MPFCRKCGRRLAPYSESCPDCGTSTTAPLVNVKKTSHSSKFKTAAPTKIAKAVIPSNEIIVSVKTISPTKPAKTPCSPPKKPPPAATKPAAPSEQKPSVEEPPKHEIKQTKLSLEEDIITNPRDYETQTFDFDLGCRHGHFFPANSTLPVSRGKAYCPICGEQLRKSQDQKRRRYRAIF